MSVNELQMQEGFQGNLKTHAQTEPPVRSSFPHPGLWDLQMWPVVLNEENLRSWGIGSQAFLTLVLTTSLIGELLAPLVNLCFPMVSLSVTHPPHLKGLFLGQCKIPGKKKTSGRSEGRHM